MYVVVPIGSHVCQASELGSTTHLLQLQHGFTRQVRNALKSGLDIEIRSYARSKCVLSPWSAALHLTLDRVQAFFCLCTTVFGLSTPPVRVFMPLLTGTLFQNGVCSGSSSKSPRNPMGLNIRY